MRGSLLLDRDDNVIGGDPAVIDYHLMQGGEEGSCLAIPALLHLVATARGLDMKLHRRVTFPAGKRDITGWASVHPGERDTMIHLSQIRSERRFVEAGPIPSQFALKLVADIWFNVDAEHRILSVHRQRSLNPDIGPSLSFLDSAQGHLWHSILRPATDEDLITLYQRGQWPAWQMLDGARVQAVEAPEQNWTLRIFQKNEGTLFEWLLLPDSGITQSKTVETPISSTDSGQSQNDNRLFVDKVAPALRGPVGRIMANAESIRDRANGPLRRDYVSYAGNIADAAGHLLALIEDASALEEVDSPQVSPDIEDIDLVDIARRAAGLLSVKAKARNIKVDCPATDEQVLCRADFRRVLQIVLNLLGNAIRYSPEDSMVWLRAEDDGDVSRLIVSDQGSGLSKEEQAIIFDKFERLGRSDDGGSGLGLYISRRLARAMQGDIIIDSAPGQGARFILELPSA
ncbi:sensor histidine kinase [Alterisphingorhabdus coralli]|uniref:histidine kinase n=1 Tax=Alterisphingorhabdus coralli TaxID=3071408 RepID=A0AA97I0N1_9SPHN|nr:HAMP domain-containing sensor histidine kinase [Parasphingorhabdus sp. SCSIO 66989]WOE73940.1 HAMP domain-containing sensor histidine kinase [Parasphingorhabdus sp. SCSIO 66989]